MDANFAERGICASETYVVPRAAKHLVSAKPDPCKSCKIKPTPSASSSSQRPNLGVCYSGGPIIVILSFALIVNEPVPHQRQKSQVEPCILITSSNTLAKAKSFNRHVVGHPLGEPIQSEEE